MNQLKCLLYAINIISRRNLLVGEKQPSARFLKSGMCESLISFSFLKSSWYCSSKTLLARTPFETMLPNSSCFTNPFLPCFGVVGGDCGDGGVSAVGSGSLFDMTVETSVKCPLATGEKTSLLEVEVGRRRWSSYGFFCVNPTNKFAPHRNFMKVACSLFCGTTNRERRD